MTSGAEDRGTGTVEERDASKAPAYPPYRDYRCPKCGFQGNDADPHIYHANFGIVCLRCGTRITD